MKTILLASGSGEHLVSLSAMLTGKHYGLIPHFDAASALSTFGKEPSIDLVISDYFLPDMDAVNFFAAIKKKTGFPPPVIFFSDRINVKDYLTALSLGAFEFFFTPIHPHELLRIVSVASGNGRGNKNIPARNSDTFDKEEFMRLTGRSFERTGV